MNSRIIRNVLLDDVVLERIAGIGPTVENAPTGFGLNLFGPPPEPSPDILGRSNRLQHRSGPKAKNEAHGGNSDFGHGILPGTSLQEHVLSHEAAVEDAVGTMV